MWFNKNKKSQVYITKNKIVSKEFTGKLLVNQFF